MVLTKESKNINPTYSGAQDIKIGQALLQATLSTLEDYQIHTVGEIIDTLSDKYQPNKIIETVALLISKLTNRRNGFGNICKNTIKYYRIKISKN